MELDYTFMEATFFKIWDGIGVTLGLTALSLLLSLPLAFYIAVIRLKRRGVASALFGSYVSFVRGTPMILQILLLYSLLPSFLNVIVKSLGLSFNVFENVNPFWYALFIFTVNTTAFLRKCSGRPS